MVNGADERLVVVEVVNHMFTSYAGRDVCVG